MNVNEVYTRLLSYVGSLDTQDAISIHKMVEHEERYESAPAPIFELSNILLMCKDDMRTATAKGAGQAAQLAAAKKLLKTVKDSWSKEKGLGFAHMKNGRQEMCNNYVAVRLNTPLPLPEAPEDVGEGFCLDRSCVMPNNSREITLPDLGELKLYVADIKAKAKAGLPLRETEWAPGRNIVLYDFGDGLPMVNTELLLLIITLLPNARAYCNEKSTTAAIYFESEHGDGCLCPVTKPRTAATAM